MEQYSIVSGPDIFELFNGCYPNRNSEYLRPCYDEALLNGSFNARLL